MTWVREPAEEPALRRALARLADLGLPTAVADRGASRSFAAFLATLPRLTVVEATGPTLVGQVKAAVAAAAGVGAPFVLYTEPDKEEFFANHLRTLIARAPDDSDVGVVLASRSDSSFQSFPPMQRYAEGVVNHLCGDALGVAGDYTYGPFLLSRSLAGEVSSTADDLGWGWRPYTFRAAHRCGMRVVHVCDHYCCPTDQRGEDDGERVHRLRQLRDNILGLIA
jgi:hypothetical protein